MLGIAGLVLMVIVGLSYREWAQYSRANTDAAQTREIVDSAERLLSGLLDAETGQREFLLTGENRYLGRYNQALQSVPSELAQLKGMLAARPAEADNAARLSDLVSRRLEHLRQTIQVRRTQGLAAATAEVLSGEGKRMMDEIRTLCAQIQRTETSAQNQASLEGEAAARGVLLVTVAGSLVLLFFLAVGLGPFVSGDHQTDPGRWFVRYGAAVLATIAAVLLRMALTPLVGATAVPFITFFPAVLIAAWFGGFRPAVLSIVLSTLAADYLFIPPVKSLVMPNAGDQITLLIFVVVGFGMALLSDAQRRAVERAKRAENSERVERQRFETTLASIGDAVIATDSQRRVTFANKVALSLVGWPEDEMLAKPLDEVFCIVNEYTRAAVESPVAKVLREGAIVGLANHTVLLARDGTEVPIDDSAAPIRDGSGTIAGTVLVFRDITERRRAERISQRLASIVESSEDAIISKDLCGIVTTWNHGAEHMLGYSAAEMIGQPISLLAPPGHTDEMPRILERISRGECVDQFQTVRRTKGGNIIHASVTVSPVYDAGGQVTGASKIIRDITAQVRAQEEVAEHRERLRVTLSSIGDAVMATDTNGRVSYLNPVAEQLTGWTSAEASGRPLEEVFRIVDEESRKTAENPVIK
ncbi:MAG: PAS domain S-box protein, partial [Acidobacteria bacterium]|nr:PAS domain S-box protein [Acidobacteriota bacterium]